MEMTTSALNWFEIAVINFDRAKNFYSAIFDFDMPVAQVGAKTMGFFLHEQGKGIGGAIVKGDGYIPSQTGALIYLAAGNDLTTVLNRVEAAGGKIVSHKSTIPPHGNFATFLDTEGNRLALHSMN